MTRERLKEIRLSNFLTFLASLRDGGKLHQMGCDLFNHASETIEANEKCPTEVKPITYYTLDPSAERLEVMATKIMAGFAADPTTATGSESRLAQSAVKWAKALITELDRVKSEKLKEGK
jgi:hypothetical protein